jgi:hypothetical protein
MLMGLDEQPTRIRPRQRLHGHIGIGQIWWGSEGHDQRSLGLAKASW